MLLYINDIFLLNKLVSHPTCTIVIYAFWHLSSSILKDTSKYKIVHVHTKANGQLETSKAFQNGKMISC